MIDLNNIRKYQLFCGKSEEVLDRFPKSIFQCCVTSPPYWQMRDYFVSDQLGQEATPEEYVDKLVEIFKKVKKVLRKDGVVWLNLGDRYSTVKKKNISSQFKLKKKNLVGIPWSVAFALRDDNWCLRQDVIFEKKNPLPDGAKDRPTRSHEYIFQLTKSPKYFYDYYAVLEKSISKRVVGYCGFGAKNQKGTYRADQNRNFIDYGTKNKRSVWSCSVSRYKGVHFATYPTELIDPCIKSSVSEKGCCPKCRSPWKRIVKKIKVPADNKDGYTSELISDGWKTGCNCKIEETIPCLVLDPFNGVGTTGIVAFANKADYVGIDINQEYLDITKKRIDNDIFTGEENFIDGYV